MTEQELILGCQKGVEVCKRELVERYSAKLYTICLRYSKSKEEGEDSLQETLIKILLNIKKFKMGIGSFEGWMARIAVNTSLRLFDKKCFKNEFAGLDHVSEPTQAPKANDQLNVQQIMKLIQELPNGYREVFNLFAIEGYSHKEVADLLDIKESTSRSQLTRAKKMLQIKITELEKIELHGTKR